MILDAIFSLILGLANAVMSVLPTSSLASTMAAVTTAATSVGTGLAPWNTFLPLSEVLGILLILVGIWLPALVVYKLANWVWRHIPEIAGFGLGAG